MLAQRCPHALAQHRAAAERHDVRGTVEQLADDPLLDLAERRLALAVEEGLDRRPELGLDELVAVGAGQPPRRGRLARPHESDEDEGHGRMKPIRSS